MKVEIYRRADGLFAWRLVARNGRIIATDGGQGYARRSACISGAMLATGYFFPVLDFNGDRVFATRADVTFVENGVELEVVNR